MRRHHPATVGSLKLEPAAFTHARMDSAKFHHPQVEEGPPELELASFDGPLHLSPREFERARMSMATFRSHERMGGGSREDKQVH